MKKLRKKTNSDICNENDINYVFLSNVVEEKSARNKIRTALSIVAKTLCGTLGPYGSTTLIQDQAQRHIMSKDGYDLCNRINFQDETARTVLEIIRNVASNQVLTVGDGSTSAIIVANALYSALTDKKNQKVFKRIASKDITSLLNDIKEFIEEEIQKESVPLSKDMHELRTIAKIATNNDPVTGDFIYDLYKKIGQFGFITTEVMKKGSKDSVDIKEGIEWKRGPIDDCFFIGQKEKKIIHENPSIFVCNSFLTESDLEVLLLELVGGVCGSANSELVIILNDCTEEVRNFFKFNRTKHKTMGSGAKQLIFSVVDIDNNTTVSKNTIEDIALMCGCEVYDKYKFTPKDFKENKNRFIGKAEKIILTEKTSQIIGTTLSEEKQAEKEKAVSLFKEELANLSCIETPNEDEDLALYQLRKRLAELTSTTAVINVGGETLTERMSRERLIEDAIFACKSAIKFGYVTGGNIMIPRILTKNFDKLSNKLIEKYSYISDRNNSLPKFITMVRDAFLESYENVLANSYMTSNEIKQILKKCLYEDVFYNLKTHSFETKETCEVINSLDTDLQILNSTVSIIGILGVTNQVITLNFSVMDQTKKKL